MENWKPISNFKGLYEISDLGRVRSVRNYRNSTFFGKIIKQRPDINGYSVVTLNKNSKKYIGRINRIVAQEFLTNPYNVTDVNHEDGDKTNNKIGNLTWMTHADNQKHAAKNNLMAKGSRNGTAKLIESDVREIRKLASGKTMTGRAIAELFSVSPSVICCIVNRKSWGWLE